MTSALAAGHRRAPVSCRAYLRPPLCSGLSASGLPCRQGARSLRDRQLPTALPALDRTSTRRHGANTRPKGHSGPSACKCHLCQAPFSPKVDGFQGNGWKSSTFPVFGPIEHLIQLGFCVLAWFFPFQGETFSRGASERRRFGGRAASARALEPFTAPACVEQCARAHKSQFVRGGRDLLGQKKSTLFKRKSAL